MFQLFDLAGIHWDWEATCLKTQEIKRSSGHHQEACAVQFPWVALVSHFLKLIEHSMRLCWHYFTFTGNHGECVREEGGSMFKIRDNDTVDYIYIDYYLINVLSVLSGLLHFPILRNGIVWAPWGWLYPRVDHWEPDSCRLGQTEQSCSGSSCVWCSCEDGCLKHSSTDAHPPSQWISRQLSELRDDEHVTKISF